MRRFKPGAEHKRYLCAMPPTNINLLLRIADFTNIPLDLQNKKGLETNPIGKLTNYQVLTEEQLSNLEPNGCVGLENQPCRDPFLPCGSPCWQRTFLFHRHDGVRRLRRSGSRGPETRASQAAPKAKSELSLGLNLKLYKHLRQINFRIK